MINELMMIGLTVGTVSASGIAAKFLSLKSAMVVMFSSMTYSNFYYTEHNTHSMDSESIINEHPIKDAVTEIFDKHMNGYFSENLNNRKVIEQQQEEFYNRFNDDPAFEGVNNFAQIQQELTDFATDALEQGLSSVDFCDKEKYKITNNIIIHFESMIKSEGLVLPEPKNNC